MQISGYGNSNAYQNDNSSKISSLQSTKSQYLAQKLQIESNEDLSTEEKEEQIAIIDEQISKLEAEISKLQSNSSSQRVENKSSSSEKNKNEKETEEDKLGPAIIVEDSLKELIKKNREENMLNN